MVDSEGVNLQYLQDFVSAKHRQRNPDSDTWMNSSLASRLPKWLKAAKNREKILKAIEILKKNIASKAYFILLTNKKKATL